MADYETSVLAQQVARLIRFGTVHSVQVSPPRCRVSFGIDPVTNTEHTTGWLSWSAVVDDTASEWRMPAAGASVMVLSPGGNTTGGLVFPAGYTDDRTPPSEEPGQHVTQYSDGATVSYDTKAHAMAVNLPAGGSIVIVTPGGMTVKGDVNIDGTLTATDVKDKTGSMQQMRDTHNIHDHNEHGDGGGVTDPPNQKMQASMQTDEEEPDQ